MQIVHEDTNRVSIHLELEVDNGDPPPKIRCITNAIMPLNLKWERNIGDGGLPNRVTQAEEFRQGRITQYLSWNRNIRTSDGGVYVCSSSNTLGENTRAHLTLIIRSETIVKCVVLHLNIIIQVILSLHPSSRISSMHYLALT